jgi:hypothetical protein
MPQLSPIAAPHRWSGRWVLVGAILLPCLYLPTLATRFDFIDDGNLVYPAPVAALGDRLQLAWHKIVLNVQHLGPFRPVLWAHWEIAADLLHGDSVAWRFGRLFWCGVATGALLLLLRELGLRPWAALLTAALAMWNPYRGEIWTSLTLSEGVAMPYALCGLFCALRAARSARSWPWDVAGFLCVLAALGCKNTFMVLVPVQVLLRIAPDGTGFREGLRRHGLRAGLLTLTLLLPLGHYIYFKLQWHPGQYETALTWAQFVRMLTTIKGGLGLDYLAPAFLVALLALAWNGLLGTAWQRYRAAFVAGLLLLVSGFVIYLPMSGVAGRYSMPAVWGADLILAALFSSLEGMAAVKWKRVALGLTACGLAGLAISNLGKQEKFAARADLLWQAVEYVERTAPAKTCIAWLEGPALNIEEGIHFCCHLKRRSRRDLDVRLLDPRGHSVDRFEMKKVKKDPVLLVSGTQEAPPAGAWQVVHEFRSFYWWGKRGYHCYLWQSEPPASSP